MEHYTAKLCLGRSGCARLLIAPIGGADCSGRIIDRANKFTSSGSLREALRVQKPR